MSDCQGKIIFNRKKGIIALNSAISNPYKIRFILAHEMGHFFLERNELPPVINCNSSEDGKNLFSVRIDSKGLYNNPFVKGINEGEANKFAAELLMPEPWFTPFVKDKPLNRPLIESISGYFRVSLSAASIRYAELGQIPCAIAVSTRRKSDWSKIHRKFPFKRFMERVSLSGDTIANQIHVAFLEKRYYDSDDTRFYCTRKDSYAGSQIEKRSLNGIVNPYAWFYDARERGDLLLYEENIAMPKLQSTLTLLTVWKG